MQPFELIATTLPWIPDPSIALAAARAEATGVLDLEHASLAVARAPLARLLGAGGGRVGVRLSARAGDLITTVCDLRAGSLDVVLLVPGDVDETRSAVVRLRPSSRRVLLEVRSAEEAALGEELGVHGLIAKGNEAGGWCAVESTFVLLQRLLVRGRLPVWAHGGVGIHSGAACLAGGAAGAIFDVSLALTRESPLGEEDRRALAQMDGSESICLGEDLDRPLRLYARPGDRALTELAAAASRLGSAPGPLPERQAAWAADVADRLAQGAVWPLGQDVAFAEPLARRYRSVGGVLDGIRRSLFTHGRDAQRLQPLAEGAPMARSLGTRFPIVQGPMTRVSDNPELARCVAEAGALPFLALALSGRTEVTSLLARTRVALGSRPWGVGILGFVPEAIRSEQLAAIATDPPAFALIAGGRPDQAQSLERQGIPTFLHVPSAALLRLFFEQGARRFVFEGRECGGHVGPLSSLVLWDRAVDVLLELLPTEDAGHGCQAIFAGGIHDARSGAMVAALAAPLAARGVEVGVLLGTAYLFTREAVECGAIVAGFQDEAVRCHRTVLLETGPGHLVRCAETGYADQFRTLRSRLLAEGRSAEESYGDLERLNLGRLRLASKGLAREGADAEGRSLIGVPDERQRAEGLYMMGQIAALRGGADGVCSMRELHEDVAVRSAERLRGLAVGGDPDARPTSRRERPVDVAIIGMACLLPGAQSPSIFWDNILGKVDSITEAPAERLDAARYFDRNPAARDRSISRWGGFFGAVPFDPVHHGIPPRSIPSIDPVQLLALEVVEAALRDAGYLDRPFRRDRTSVILGVGGLTDAVLRYALRAWLPTIGDAAGRRAGPLPRWTEETMPGTIPNVVAGRVANRFDLGGMNFAVDAACATSLAAVQVAARELAMGSSDMVIAGAADVAQNSMMYLAFSAAGAFSPDGRCRPFDHRANGIVASEGVGVVILKRLEDAERDGDLVYAVLKGIGASSDGRALGLTAPRPEGQMAALDRAYAAAGVSPGTVGLLEAHGTGTVVGDQAEVRALRDVFERAGAARQSCAIGSVKSMIGHTKATAGMAGLIKSALALHHRVLPPTLHVEHPEPRLRLHETPFYPNVDARPWLSSGRKHPRRAAVSAFGFGGTNFHAILEEAPTGLGGLATDPVTRRWPMELVLLRAASVAELVETVDHVERALAEGAEPSLAELAKAATGAPAPGSMTLAVVFTSLLDAREKLARARRKLVGGAVRLRDPAGVYFSTEPLLAQGRGKLALVFPGQGSQYVDMGRDLTVHLSEVRDAFDRADAALATKLSRPLSDWVFPPPGFDDPSQQAAAHALTATDVAQPALGALSFGLLRLLEGLGLRADMFAGHSYGEYVALAAAGVFSEDVLYGLSYARGRCLADAVRDQASPGRMAAVLASPDAVAKLTASLDGVWIANRNGPRQTVLSGTDDGIDAAVALVSSLGIEARVLPVACAFHSPLVAAAQGPLTDVLARVELGDPSVPVFANVTARPYPARVGAISALLRDQLVHPVDFAGQVDAMYAAGARVFVEVGPRDVLAGLVGQVLEGRDAMAVSLDGPLGGGRSQLLHALALVAAEGGPVRLDRLLRGRVERTLHVDQLAEVCRPRALSRTTWLVDGGKATPAFPASVAATDDDRAPDADALETVLPAIPTDDSDGAIARWQELMHHFLDVQRDVMLRHSGGRRAVSGERNRASNPASRPMAASGNPPPHALAPTATQELAPDGGRTWSRAEVLTTLQRLASEKTGYETQMLKPDLKLDADLGIGSLKRIEILSGLASRMALPAEVVRAATERLMWQKTLGRLADAFFDLLGTGASSRAALPAAAPAARGTVPRVLGPRSASTSDVSPLGRHVLRPVEVAPAGTVAPIQGMVLVTDDGQGVARALADALRRAGAQPILLCHRLEASVSWMGADSLGVSFLDGDSIAAAVLEAKRRHGPLGGVFHLLPLRSSANGVAEMQGRLAVEVKGLYHLARAVAADLGEGNRGRFLVAATSGGSFGGRERGIEVAVQGAISGLVKALAREWPGARCRALDLDLPTEAQASAQLVLQEARLSGDDVELRYIGGKRMAMRPSPAERGESGRAPPLLDSSSVVLVTGGAAGITAEVVRELATRYRPTLLLVGHSPLPDVEAPETVSIHSPTALRAFLAGGAERSGQRSLADVEKRALRLLRAREIRESLSAVSKSGAVARYYSADVRDGATFGALIDHVYATYGRIDAVIHGAGVTADRLVQEMEPESFDRTFDTKALGALVLAQKLRPELLRLLVLFSSMSGSFGNRGQADYSAANGFLNGLATYLDGRWPGRVVSIAWGPWDVETGMMSAELIKHFRDLDVPLIEPAAGRKAADLEIRHRTKGEAEVILGPLRAAR